MATERKAPDVLLVQTNLSGGIGDITDDPDSPDTNWLEYIANNVDTVCRVSFPTPTGSPTVGVDLQEFKIWVRQRPDGAGADPTVRIELYEDGSPLATILADIAVSSTTGALYSGFWNANLLGTPDGSLVECYIYGDAVGGAPGNRCTVEVGAVEWNIEYTVGVVHEGTGQSDGSSTAAAAGNVEHTGEVQSDGTSTAAAAGNVEHTGAAQSDGFSTSTADGEVEHTGQAQSDGTSTATGTGTVGAIHEGAGQSDGLSTATGAGNVEHTGIAQSDGLSSATASGNVVHTGAGQTDGTSSATGSGVCILVGTGQSDGTSTATGTGTTGGTVEGAAQSDGVATATGSAQVDFVGAGLSEGTSTATGTGTISDFYDVVCTMGVEEVHRFEDHTENNAIGICCAMVDFSPSLEWTHPEPTVWNGNGSRVIEIVGAS